MTQLDFYTGVSDRLAFVCRLLRKVQLSGAKIGVCGPQSSLRRLDVALWDFEPVAFVPHLDLSAGVAEPGLIASTPVLLAEHVDALDHREILLNLGAEVPNGFEQFQRVLEVVSLNAEQVQTGRQRFRHYKSLGHEIKWHEVTA